jgi:hypothetical protein
VFGTWGLNSQQTPLGFTPGSGDCREFCWSGCLVLFWAAFRLYQVVWAVPGSSSGLVRPVPVLGWALHT